MPKGSAKSEECIIKLSSGLNIEHDSALTPGEARAYLMAACFHGSRELNKQPTAIALLTREICGLYQAILWGDPAGCEIVSQGIAITPSMHPDVHELRVYRIDITCESTRTRIVLEETLRDSGVWNVSKTVQVHDLRGGSGVQSIDDPNFADAVFICLKNITDNEILHRLNKLHSMDAHKHLPKKKS